MSRSVFTVLFAALFAVIFSSCASVLKGTSEDIRFESSPSGASVYVDGIKVGKTPVTVSLKKNAKDNFRVELDGYATVERPLDSEYDPVALLNICWDLSTTDLITGAAFQYSENSHYIELRKK